MIFSMTIIVFWGDIDIFICIYLSHCCFTLILTHLFFLFYLSTVLYCTTTTSPLQASGKVRFQQRQKEREGGVSSWVLNISLPIFSFLLVFIEKYSYPHKTLLLLFVYPSSIVLFLTLPNISTQYLSLSYVVNVSILSFIVVFLSHF